MLARTNTLNTTVTVVLSGLYIYPIKSASGISLPSAKVEERGLQYDRRWMLVDETGKFLTQRQFPRLALISVEIGENSLIVKAPGMEALSVPLELNISTRLLVQIWNDTCEAIPVGEKAAQWFSDFLSIPCQLVYMPYDSIRPVPPGYPMPTNQVSFADAFPFLLISEASLQDLNKRLATSVPMNRFRPNLVVSGCEAFEEDYWRLIRIGSIPFHVVKPCDRCSIVTVDQVQGIREKEPLRTLALYRRRNGKILFGQNLINGGLGSLHVGDSVELHR